MSDLSLLNSFLLGDVWPGYTLSHVYAQQGECLDLIRNGGFELGGPGSVEDGWVNATEDQPAIATTAIVQQGERALQIGLVDEALTEGVSVVRQTVRLPEGNGRSVLSFRYLPYADGEPSAGDLQYVEIFNDFNSQLISRLVERRSNDRTWRLKQFDLTPYAGQQVTIYFGVRNDDQPVKTAMFVDDVSLTSCNSSEESVAEAGEGEDRSAVAANQVQPFLTSTPTPTPTPTVTSTPSATATATSTPTPTPTTLTGSTPGICATSVAGPLLVNYGLTNGNQSAVIEISANKSTQVYVTGPNNFSYSRSQAGPYSVNVPLLPGSNVFTVSVLANRISSSCQVDSLTLTTPVTIPGPGTVSCPTTTPEPFTVELIATDNPQSKIIRVNIGNGDRVVVRGPLGTVERTGTSPFDIPVQLNLGAVNTFEVDAHVRPIDLGGGCIVGNYTLRKSITYNDLSTPIPGPTDTPLPPITPSTCGSIAMAPRPSSCQSILINGGFETNEGWHFGIDPVKGVFTNEQVSVGGRSVLLGNPPNRGDENVKTYSSIRQPVTIPANVEQLQLRWRRLDISEEGATANPSSNQDRQDVIILSAYPDLEPIEIVSRLRCNSSQWEEFAVNLDAERYAHDRNVVVYFNVFNDGLGGRSWSYLDNVELLVCPAPGSYTNPNMGAVGKGNPYVSVQPPAFSPTSTYTPVAVARATYTPYEVVLPTMTNTPIPYSSDTQESSSPTVVTVVVTATPDEAADSPEGTSLEDSTVEDVQPIADVAPTVTQSTNGLVATGNRTSGLPVIDEVEASNQFLENRPWFNWLTSCGILLGILAVIGYFAWGILKTLADGPENRNNR